ncbi:putative alpha beta hydrolase fold-3 domain-containing protein [Rosellinia necatrix]|uniref:Putative alpha beta hydrolase fold-3 domain-containing protein n=1 Tax=Rosellinia necatrix TaxID=77044 RepID=A0A1W2TR12_ROSNE|nr:putative alpha beta hydrolase fold-3 domain-containing protein [Rosellinia necatrix]
MATPGLRHPLVSYQPLRFLFQLSYAATILLRLPYYAVIALVPGLRPNRRWTAKQTFMTRLLYPFLDVISRVAITETLTLAPGKEGDRFQTVPPASADAYLGPLASAAVRPATIGGTWFPHAPTDLRTDEKKTVVLYFHGGAFIQGDGRAATCGDLASRLLAARPRGAGADLVFSVQYRLSGCGGANPFPAALQDAVSAYLFLVRTVGVPARRIIVGGDSAGGNLATALLRYLAEFGREIGGSGGAEEPPRAALLFSPWVAPFDHDGLAGSAQRATDFLPMRFPRWGAEAYAGDIPAGDADVARPYVTPLGNPFATPVPLFVNAADAELLYEGILRWVAEMRGVDGNAVEVYHEADAVHDTFLAGELLGFEDSAWVVAGKVGEFLGRL